ncbi:MAG: calcium/sodium antiporter [Bacteroidales bacterium]|nr:calcium/sodium antiporter [Bacteroidales bacterium]
MILNIALILLGLALVVFGADYLVDGASALARRFGVSEFVIGLTIVGFGTSMPEMVVSVTGALAGNADISVGNVIGSNIMNVLLILGLTAMLSPIAITRENMRRDIPITLLVTVLFIVCGYFGGLSRIEGFLFLALFTLYLFWCFRTGTPDGAEEANTAKDMSVFKAVLLVAGGLGALIAGGKLFVESAITFAKSAGVSDKFIAITLLAGGTSLPELATCIVAAAKKRGQLALGNILGSNIFNILLILGLSAGITPLSFSAIKPVDMGVLLLSMLLVAMSAYTGRNQKIDRFDAALMLAVEAAYLVWLGINL